MTLPRTSSIAVAFGLVALAVLLVITNFRARLLDHSAIQDSNVIEGVVVDERDAPLAKMIVRCVEFPSSETARTLTDARGAFRFEGRVAEAYAIQVWEPNPVSMKHPTKASAAVGAKRPWSRLRIRVADKDRANNSITGRIITSYGLPIPRATVHLSLDQQNSLATSTGPDGRFKIDGLQAGPFALAVTQPNYVAQHLPEVRVEGDRDVGDIVLQDGGHVRIRRQYPSGLLARSAEVIIRPADSDGSIASYAESKTITGIDWKSKCLAPGRYVVIAIDRILPAMSEATEVSVEARETLDLSLVMETARVVTLDFVAAAPELYDNKTCELIIRDSKGFACQTIGGAGAAPWKPVGQTTVTLRDGHYGLEARVDGTLRIDRKLVIDRDWSERVPYAINP